MEYNWPVGLYWDCFCAQWGRDTTRKITEACIFVTGRVWILCKRTFWPPYAQSLSKGKYNNFKLQVFIFSFSFADITLPCVMTLQTPFHHSSFPSVYGNLSLVKRPGLFKREVLTMKKGFGVYSHYLGSLRSHLINQPIVQLSSRPGNIPQCTVVRNCLRKCCYGQLHDVRIWSPNVAWSVDITPQCTSIVYNFKLLC